MTSRAGGDARGIADDPVLVDIIGSHLLAIAEEMGVALIRSGYSPNIKERHDCSTALLDLDGHTIAQAEHIPIHMGSMLGFIPAVVDQYAGDIHPGDAFISNDPYLGGSTHLPDVTVVAPLFAEGEVVGFAAAVAHHAEFGGSVGVAPDIYSEGLRIPIVRVIHRGELVEEIIRFILLNTRVEAERSGDLRAQFAAVALGVRRFDELLAAYGSSDVLEATSLNLDKAEQQARAALAQLPEGTYTFTDVMDSDGAGTSDIPICATVKISHDAIEVDLTGSGLQVRGQINTARAAVEASIYYTVKAILDPTLPANAGFYRIVDITIPEGTIVNSLPPAPVFMRSDTCQRVVDAILGAMAPIIPDRVPAASNGSISAFHFTGYDPTRQRPFAYVEVVAGGAGALPDRDGQDAVQTHLTNTANTPIEAVEQAYPVRLRRYALREDAGGLGRYRGGVGIIREIEALVDDVRVTVKGDRVRRGPWGLDGGGAGAVLRFELDPDTDHAREFTRADNGAVLPAGSVLRVETAGGGGHGRPALRDADAHARDRRDGIARG
ncbi:MAG: hydantoinase B/oxoprolinase family protein [Nitriliruptoraceae bacterium]